MSKKLLEEGTIKRWKKLAGLNEVDNRFRPTRGPQTRTSMDFEVPVENGQMIKGHVVGTKDELKGSRTNYKFVLEDGSAISLGQGDAYGGGNTNVEDTEYNFGLTKQGQALVQSEYKRMQGDKDAATQVALDKDAEDRFNALSPDASTINQ